MSTRSYFVSPAECSTREIFPGVKITAMGGEKMMISYVDLQPNSVVELHSHPHEQMGILIKGEMTFTIGGETRNLKVGEMTFTIGGETRNLKVGEMWRIPGDVPHTVKAGPNGAEAIDIFHPVREDYL